MDEQQDIELEEELSNAVAAVWERRKPIVLERVDLLIAAGHALQAGLASPEQIAEALVESHRLSGALGSFGFATESESAAQIEGHLEHKATRRQNATLIVNLATSMRATLSGKPRADTSGAG